MITKEIEDLRDQLNTMLDSEDYAYNEILLVSQQLDTLIVRYLREN